MLKGGIYLDIENLIRNGGWGLRFRAVKRLVEARGFVPLRANAYMAVDREREASDAEYRRKKRTYRHAMRNEGFHVVLKAVRRYRDEDGEIVTKSNSDLDLAVDALLQGDNLDYVLLGTGDGDFLRLVRALQNRGKRVDLLSFANTSTGLREEVDVHFDGFLMPGILPDFPADPEAEPTEEDPPHTRGWMHAVNEEKGYGFLTVRTGLGIDDVRTDVFLHINDIRTENGYPIDNEAFADLKRRRTILEFDMVEQDDGRVKASNAKVFPVD